MSTTPRRIIVALGLTLGLAAPADATAQYAPEALTEEGAVPAVGERMEYRVRLGRLRLGQAALAVEAQEDVAGTSAYRVALDVEIGAPMLKFEDRLVSWIAPEPFRSVAFERKDSEVEGGRRRYDFDDDVLDELAALYLMRTLPLAQGTTYEFDRYFAPDGNPLTFRVVGHESVRVPAGRFETIVVEPIIPALSAFRAEADARLYVTNDERRVLVQIETRTKAGRLILYMTEYEEGTHP
ncbi:MAG: DUF3108 domain-containing protein [Gemmatimonadota bacterium]